MSGTTNIPAVVVLIRRDDKMLFLRRSNTGFQDGKYCPPTGHVEAGESFLQAAVREVWEETGLEITADQLAHVHTQHSMRSPDNIRIHVFFELEHGLEDGQGEPRNNEPDRHDELVWMPVDGLPYENIQDLMAIGLKCITEGIRYDEVGWDKLLAQY